MRRALVFTIAVLAAGCDTGTSGSDDATVAKETSAQMDSSHPDSGATPDVSIIPDATPHHDVLADSAGDGSRPLDTAPDAATPDVAAPDRPVPDQSVDTQIVPDILSPTDPCGPGERVCGDACCAWNDEVVTNYIDNRNCSIAVDSQKRPHIAYEQYWAPSQLEVRYSHRDGTWKSSRVYSATSSAHIYPSLALDSSDVPHIAYLDKSANRLRLAVAGSSSYVFATGKQYGAAITFVGDELHLVYRGENSLALASSADSGNAWSWYGSWPATSSRLGLAVDALGHTHVVYAHSGDVTNAPGFRHGENDAGQWTTTILDSDPTAGGLSSVAVHGDRVYVSHEDRTTNQIRVSVRDASGWTTENVPGGLYGVSNGTVAVDSTGRIHLVYSGYRPSAPTTYGVIHAIRESAGWVLEMAAPDGGGWSDLVLDALDTPHICYQTKGRDLRYVTH